MQRFLIDNTQLSQETNIHAVGGIRTCNPNKRAAADPRLRPHSHWARRLPYCYHAVIPAWNLEHRSWLKNHCFLYTCVPPVLTQRQCAFCPQSLLCVLCGSRNDQRLYPWRALTGWFLMETKCHFCKMETVFKYYGVACQKGIISNGGTQDWVKFSWKFSQKDIKKSEVNKFHTMLRVFNRCCNCIIIDASCALVSVSSVLVTCSVGLQRAVKCCFRLCRGLHPKSGDGSVEVSRGRHAGCLKHLIL